MKLSDEINIITEMVEEARAELKSDRSAAAENNIAVNAWPMAANWGIEKTLSHVLKLLEGVKADSLMIEKKLQRHGVETTEPESELKPVGKYYT